MNNLYKNSLLFICIAITTISCDNSERFIYLPYQGGLDSIIVDTKAPLDELVAKLKEPWKPRNTYKGYWLGYTNTMYSIAYHKEEAIPALTELIKSTNSKETKIAALFTLHLIGINSQVAGRTYEEFKNKPAREAMISCLNDSIIHTDVIRLLKRDPWASDIPYFMKYLAQSNANDTILLSNLRKHIDLIESIPLWQEIPDEILNKKLTIRTNNPDSYNEIIDIVALKKALTNRIVIDSTILESKEWRKGIKSYNRDTREAYILVTMVAPEKDLHLKPRVQDINLFIYTPMFDYSQLNDIKFYYAYTNNKLYIYSSQKAREVLLNWWKNLSNQEKVKIANTNERYKRENGAEKRKQNLPDLPKELNVPILTKPHSAIPNPK